MAMIAEPNVKPLSVISENSLSDEAWREYDWLQRVYRINNPVTLFSRHGGTTHRVLDAEGVVHCVPAPGEQGCVLRWKTKDPNKPVQF